MTSLQTRSNPYGTGMVGLVLKYIKANIVKKIIDIHVKYMILLIYYSVHVLEYVSPYPGACTSVIFCNFLKHFIFCFYFSLLQMDPPQTISPEQGVLVQW